ncbi:MAG: hypothetical protein JNK74_29425, partial [Candidatus Hydrogenedentes bacterium]|nr:hypothetical protein [Candidatus Hydrogenedentota bacterium]
PTLSTEPGRLMFDADAMAKYLQGGRTVCACPGQGPAPQTPDDRDYVYLGFALQNEEDMRQFATAYHHVSTGLPEALEVWTRGEVAALPPSESSAAGAGPGVRRLREGVERFFITDINNPAAAAVTQSNIPVIIEWPDHHPTGTGKQGGNILYMDGHVEFVAYPGKWPMTEESMKILCNMAGRGPIVIAGN